MGHLCLSWAGAGAHIRKEKYEPGIDLGSKYQERHWSHHWWTPVRTISPNHPHTSEQKCFGQITWNYFWRFCKVIECMLFTQCAFIILVLWLQGQMTKYLFHQFEIGPGSKCYRFENGSKKFARTSCKDLGHRAWNLHLVNNSLVFNQGFELLTGQPHHH